MNTQLAERLVKLVVDLDSAQAYINMRTSRGVWDTFQAIRKDLKACIRVNAE